MVLEPLKEEQYYEVDPSLYIHLDIIIKGVSIQELLTYLFTKYLILLQIREPFSVMSVVKSPMGLMMGFMVLVMFVMPKLMENMGKVLSHKLHGFEELHQT